MGMKKGLLKTDVTLRVLYECRRADSDRAVLPNTALLCYVLHDPKYQRLTVSYCVAASLVLCRVR